MAITLKRQLNESEKGIILERHGRKCFATGHVISSEDKVHFDHIRAYALGGPSELDNIAPMCEFHNKAKGMLPLEDYRTKLRLEKLALRRFKWI
jgi:5-methylcytosine-specific restriction endonuclease McrA